MSNVQLYFWFLLLTNLTLTYPPALVVATRMILDNLDPQSIEVNANVQLINKRIRRSVGKEDGKISYQSYHVNVTAAGVTHELLLEPAGLTFSPGFKAHHIRTEDDGRVSWTNVTPNQKRLAEIERKIYRDVRKSTAVRVEEDGEGGISLNGVVNGARIRRVKRGTSTIHKVVLITNMPEGATEAEPTPPPKVEVEQQGPANASADMMILPGYKPGLSRRTGDMGPLTLRPELAVVIDYNLGRQMDAAGVDPIEYMAIMVNTVNALYAATSDPTIIASLVGVHVMKDEKSQDFVTSAKREVKIKGEGSEGEVDQYNLDRILRGYYVWLYDNRELIGAYDVAPLQLGVTFDLPGQRGLAPIPGACQFNFNDGNISVAATTTQDIGAYYRGSLPLTHELTHCLGAPHDSEGEATECTWDDGYIMSYKGWGTLNHFKLSPCSLRLIDKYARSPIAACLQQPSGRAPPPQATKSVLQGNRIGTKQICEKHTAGWVPVPRHPDEICRNTICKPPGPPGPDPKQVVINYQPGNGAPCGSMDDGHCMNGWCVGQGPWPSLDEYCATMTSIEGARFLQPNPQFDICATGSPLVCEYEIDGQIVVSKPEFNATSGMKCNSDPKEAIAKGVNAFDGVCFRGRCMLVKEIQDPDKECILTTGKEEAHQMKRNGANGCKPAVRCMYGTESEIIQSGNDGTGCKDDGGSAGTCTDGVCKTNFRLHTLIEICEERMGTAEARPVRELDRNLYCTQLTCKFDQVKTEPLPTPEGTICGPLRRCKNGKCVICS